MHNATGYTVDKQLEVEYEERGRKTDRQKYKEKVEGLLITFLGRRTKL